MKNVLTFLLVLIALPVSAQDERPLEISKIEDGIYLHTSFKNFKGYGLVDSNGLVVLNNNQAYIIDTPWSEKDTKILLSWINESGYKFMASISTHSHEES